jgi:hypothetical protein
MTPAEYCLELYRGDSGHWRFKFSSSAGQPTDLTGVTAKAEIRDKPGGTHITPMSCVVTLPNIVDLILAATDSANLLPKGVWDLQLTYGSGEVLTPIGGAVTVTADVTDSTPEPP